MLLARHYEELLLVSLAGAASNDKSFSADTGMAEVLVLGRKRDQYRPELDPATAEASWISLKRRPQSTVEAYETSRAVRQQTGPQHKAGGTFEIRLGGHVAGSGIRATLGDGGCAGISDLSLARAAMSLERGCIPLPRVGENLLVPMTHLGHLGTRGPLDRDVGARRGSRVGARGPFEIVPVDGVPTFPVLWGHHAPRERKLVVEPDSMGRPLPGRETDAASVYRTASRLHFNRDFQINAQSLAACLTPVPAIGGRAWPSLGMQDASWETALAAWANTTLGLLLFWWVGSAQQQGRTVLTISRLPELPVLDLRALAAGPLRRLRDAFSALAEEEFLPAHRATEDPTRKELDRLVLEDALGFEPAAMGQVALIREKWCAEPTVHGGKQS